MERNPEHRNLERYSEWLDTKFRIPGTNITFGIDFLIGLFPVVGDVMSFSLSGGLLIIMIKKGASGRALSLMIFNIALDAIFGSIPFFGDIFDLFFKANKRNLDLFQSHFEEGKHQGGAWPVILAIFFVLLIILVAIIYLAIKLVKWFWYLLS